MNKLRANKLFAKYFALIAIPLLLVTTILTYLTYLNYSEAHLSLKIENERQLLDLQKREIAISLKSIFSDISFIKNQKSLNNYINTPSFQNTKELSEELLNFSKSKEIYDQIRFIDKNGNEKIRINYNQGSPAIVKTANLQNKKNRYYFKNSINLDSNQIYISPFDLNVENAKIEIPLKPMIRFCLPIFNREKETKGVIIFNYLGQQLINKIEEKFNFIQGDLFLLNSDSYYLSGKIKNQNWAFMYKDRKNINFKNSHEKEWNEINNYNAGMIDRKNNVYLYDTIYPFWEFSKKYSNEKIETREPINHQGYYWKILIAINKTKLLAKLSTTFIKIYFLILAAGLIISFILSKSIIAIKKSNQIKFQLERKNSVLAMIVTANHELNQPLSIIFSMTDMLKRSSKIEKISDNQIKYLENIIKAAQKMNETLRRFKNTKEFSFSEYNKDINMVIFDDEKKIK